MSKPEVYFTEEALARLQQVLASNTEARAIRLHVKTTGCSGLSYVLEYVTTTEPSDLYMLLDNKCNFYIEKNSYIYLKGLKIDYVKQGLNHKFIFINPNQTGQCGCGESFTVSSN